MRRSRLIATAASSAPRGSPPPRGGRPGRDFDTDMSGFEEVPLDLDDRRRHGRGRVNRAGTELRYTLRYHDLEGAVQQSHIHFGARRPRQRIVVFLCTNLGNGRAGPPRPAPAAESPATRGGRRSTAADATGRPRRASRPVRSPSSARHARGRDLRQRPHRELTRRPDPRPARPRAGARGHEIVGGS